MKKLIPVLLSVLLFCSCATHISMSKISRLQMGMTKDQVRSTLGDPYLVRSGVIRSDGKTEETWEYNSYFPTYRDANKVTGNIAYWTKFVDGKLVFYGHPGDYGTTQPKREQIDLNIHQDSK